MELTVRILCETPPPRSPVYEVFPRRRRRQRLFLSFHIPPPSGSCKSTEVAHSVAMNRRESSGTTRQRLEAVDDLTTLAPVNEDIIVSCIRERFMSDTIYTNIGSSALVAVNPHKYIPSNSDAVLHKYAAEYRDTSPGKTPLPPHIFQLANNAYYHMRRTTQDQSILLTCVAVCWSYSPTS